MICLEMLAGETGRLQTIAGSLINGMEFMQLYRSLPALHTPVRVHSEATLQSATCASGTHVPAAPSFADTSLKLSFKSAESSRQLEDQPLQHTQCAGCQSGPAPSGQTVQVAEWKCIYSDSTTKDGAEVQDRAQIRGRLSQAASQLKTGPASQFSAPYWEHWKEKLREKGGSENVTGSQNNVLPQSDIIPTCY